MRRRIVESHRVATRWEFKGQAEPGVQQTAAAILISPDMTALGAAAAAELYRMVTRVRALRQARFGRIDRRAQSRARCFGVVGPKRARTLANWLRRQARADIAGARPRVTGRIKTAPKRVYIRSRGCAPKPSVRNNGSAPIITNCWWTSPRSRDRKPGVTRFNVWRSRCTRAGGSEAALRRLARK